MMKIAFAGPASNFILVLCSCALMRIIGVQNLIEFNNHNSTGLILYFFAIINMTLGIFNLLPIYPLDGGQIFGGFFDRINPDLSSKLRMYGPQFLLLL